MGAVSRRQHWMTSDTEKMFSRQKWLPRAELPLEILTFQGCSWIVIHPRLTEHLLCAGHCSGGCQRVSEAGTESRSALATAAACPAGPGLQWHFVSANSTQGHPGDGSLHRAGTQLRGLLSGEQPPSRVCLPGTVEPANEISCFFQRNFCFHLAAGGGTPRVKRCVEDLGT